MKFDIFITNRAEVSTPRRTKERGLYSIVYVTMLSRQTAYTHHLDEGFGVQGGLENVVLDGRIKSTSFINFTASEEAASGARFFVFAKKE